MTSREQAIRQFVSAVNTCVSELIQLAESADTRDPDVARIIRPFASSVAIDALDIVRWWPS